MTLDSFRSDHDGSNQEEDVDEHDTDEDSSKNAHNIERGGSESDEHYKSKCIAALQLSKLGYEVEGEKKLESTGLQADIWGERSVNMPSNQVKENESGLLPETIIIEVGHLTAERAKKFNKECSRLLWLEKDSTSSDSSAITLSGMLRIDDDVSIIDSRKMGDMEYINSSGEAFSPNIQDIYIEKYKILAERILSKFDNATEFDVSDIHNEVSIDGYRIKETDIEKVLDALGFV